MSARDGERDGRMWVGSKEVKERFTRWYNKRHGRRGTLWMDRFKSVMVENGEALRTMAQYIDLNPVRAKLAGDPAEYRWCGWAEALGGSRRAKRGICRVMDCALDSWESGRSEARENYAGALEVILRGAKRQAGSLEAGSELVGAGDVVESATRRLEADCTVVVEADEAGSTAAVATKSRKPMSVGSLLLKRVRYLTPLRSVQADSDFLLRKSI